MINKRNVEEYEKWQFDIEFNFLCDTLNAVLRPESYRYHLSKRQGRHIYIYYIELYRALYQLWNEVVFLFFSSNFVYSVCMSILLALSLSLKLLPHIVELATFYQFSISACRHISVCVNSCMCVCVRMCVFAVWNGKLQTGILYKTRQQNFDRNFGFKASFVAP